jgi:hypothetical protein
VGDEMSNTPEVITKAVLTKRYGTGHATTVLSLKLKALPRVKGQQTKFEVIEPLPSKEEFLELQRAKFTSPLGELVSDAFSELESLKDELQDWYDNLPESFQNGDKGSELQDAVSNLENLSEPSIGEVLAGVPVFYLPPVEINSRSDRCADAAGRLRACVDALEGEENAKQLEGASDLADELGGAADEAASVDFPGMY